MSFIKKMYNQWQRLKQNLWYKSALVVGAMGLSDFFWARYITRIAESSAIEASNWGVLVVLLGAFVVVSYVEDRRLILPACVGAWVGTYLGIVL